MAVCERCRVHGGLCLSCAERDRSILPQLAANPLVKLMPKKGANESYVPAVVPIVPDPAAERIRERRARKAAKRLARAVAGDHTRTRAA